MISPELFGSRTDAYQKFYHGKFQAKVLSAHCASVMSMSDEM